MSWTGCVAGQSSGLWFYGCIPAPMSSPVSLERPSLFELLAEEQLRQLFHPITRYVLSVRVHFLPPSTQHAD